MMPEPIKADERPLGPLVVQIKKGVEYYWCACGRSQNQPFCDGSHKGTGLHPMRFVAQESETLSLCGCKHTQAPPYCDNSHDFL